MEDLRVCSMGHALEPLAQCCNFGHETCICLKCPSKECTFRTKPAIKEFKDLLQSEIDEHLSDCQADVKEEGEDEAKMKGVNEDLSKTNKKLEKRTCPMCCKLFYSMGNMRAHVKSHHERKGRFNCQMCEKTFSSNNALQYHEKRSHSNGGDIACENCEETFSNFEGYSTHRKSHRSVHNKVKVRIYPHNCDQCDAVFKRKGHLNSHIEGMHGGERYPCSQCGKEFQNKSNLNRHVKKIHK